jgi:MFS family permease
MARRKRAARRPGEARQPSAGAEFSLRSVALPAFAPAALFGLASGAMLPVIVASAYARGASTAVTAFIGSLLGIGSLLTNIPSGILATRVGERRAMLVAAAVTVAGLALCVVYLGRGPGSVVVFATGVFLVGCASSVYNLARQSYLTEMVPPGMRARALSTLGGTMRIGVFVGPFLGALATTFGGVSAAYLVGVVAILLAALVVHRAPDLELSAELRLAGAQVTTRKVVRGHWRLFASLGLGVLLLSAIRQTRQTVIPLWAHHIGISPAESSIVYGIAGAVDAMTFYPAGRVMDRHGRRIVAVPCVLVMGLACILMPLTHGLFALILIAMLMGFGNGIGSGIVMTLAADVSPAAGRLTFLAVWRELADAGAALGPVILSLSTGVAGLGNGLVVSGLVGVAAGAALWRWVPRPATPAAGGGTVLDAGAAPLGGPDAR